MPTPESNHILWILWHMGRMEDSCDLPQKPVPLVMLV